MGFKTLRLTGNSIRVGEIKGKTTPRFFMINNFGGGGTNVSRFFVYSPLFATGKSEILLNYYYLNTKFEKTPAFNTDLLSNIVSFNDIREFIEYVRRNLIEISKSCLPGTEYHRIGWDPVALVDSGSGNIFRDLSVKLSEDNFESLFQSEIREYIGFCEKLRFDLSIGLDIAGKYTWKKGENVNTDYLAKLKEFSKPRWNLILSKLFLQEFPERTGISYYAPIHGNSPTDYLNNLLLILEIEKKLSRKYAGFAVGGLGNEARDAIYKTVKLTRDKLNELGDERPIHILGVGSVQNIIPLSLNGADTFDCHSPWRRASEDKLIIPLLNSDFEITAKDKPYWQYVPIGLVSELECDCEVCKKNTLSDLRALKEGEAEEKIYFRILAYKHNIHQQEVLCELVKSEVEISKFAEGLPKSKYKEEIHRFLALRSQKTWFDNSNITRGV
jgi:tRNA-guanine family transglycosylase